MAAIITAEDGSGKTDANSYVTLAEAETYFETVLTQGAWATATTDNKNRALIFATRTIDASMQFNGWKKIAQQALQWPRALAKDVNLYGGAYYATPDSYINQYFNSDTVPQCVKNATCELARFMLDYDRTQNPVGENIKSLKLDGVIQVEFDKKDRQPILPKIVSNLLHAVGTPINAGFGFSRLVRT